MTTNADNLIVRHMQALIVCNDAHLNAGDQEAADKVEEKAARAILEHLPAMHGEEQAKLFQYLIGCAVVTEWMDANPNLWRDLCASLVSASGRVSPALQVAIASHEAAEKAFNESGVDYETPAGAPFYRAYSDTLDALVSHPAMTLADVRAKAAHFLIGKNPHKVDEDRAMEILKSFMPVVETPTASAVVEVAPLIDTHRKAQARRDELVDSPYDASMEAACKSEQAAAVAIAACYARGGLSAYQLGLLDDYRRVAEDGAREGSLSYLLAMPREMVLVLADHYRPDSA